ncbi:MAG: OB-fold nucleic acid binding domain-containing protein, partial [Phycisphaeraceae bacterium]|nr:OB-fold nucleic acid binding domain-containing protein [Phycisphaeraceae bacterium]
MFKRTHSCGQLRLEDVGREVALAGWVNNYRDFGGLVFIDVRDREGITQLVFHPENSQAHAEADKLRHEDVIAVSGKVVERGVDEQGNSLENPKLATGKIEVDCHRLEILSKSATPPFNPQEAHKVNEEQRLKHRYIDLRRPRMLQILKTRHRVTKIMRDFFDERGFYEVETPFL